MRLPGAGSSRAATEQLRSNSASLGSPPAELGFALSAAPVSSRNRIEAHRKPSREELLVLFGERVELTRMHVAQTALEP
jgi:hypothetical protein